MDKAAPAIVPDREDRIEFHGLDATSHAPTWGQYGMWKVSRRIGRDSSILNQSTVVDLGAGIEPAAVDAALVRVVARHESLRTCFTESDAERPRADVLSAGAIAMNRYSYSGDGSVEDFVRLAAKVEGGAAFDPESDLPLRAAVVDCPDERRYLIVTCSHVAVDNYAMRLLGDEISTLLASGADAEAPPTAMQPRDLAEIELSERGTAENGRSMRHWRDALMKAPANTGAPAESMLRSDRGTLFGAIDSSAIPKALTALTAKLSSTPSSVLLAAIGTAYADVTGESRMFFQVVCHNRRSEAARRYIGCTVQGGPFYLEARRTAFSDTVLAAEQAVMKAYIAARYDSDARDAVLSEVESTRGVAMDIRAIISDELSMRMPRVGTGADPAPIQAAAIFKDGKVSHAVIDAAPSERINFHLGGSATEARVSILADPDCFSPRQLESMLNKIETVLVEAC
ncbi:condensation domain-containing protein [Glycomyces rhizosphaerae]|uniref:Condensation domain-containing protein n=1 Tax=Glycomyces rhizosphaerae TaxID=2054422 RepID=A0ABV7Q4T8_9ACTN